MWHPAFRARLPAAVRETSPRSSRQKGSSRDAAEIQSVEGPECRYVRFGKDRKLVVKFKPSEKFVLLIHNRDL